MAPTSLWELRKRPMPQGTMSAVVASVVPPPPRRKPSPSAATRPPTKESSRLTSRSLERAFDAVDGCKYRGGGVCLVTRTLKECGARHSLCATHRDRALANQRRYDKKKRAKQTKDAEEEKETQRKQTRVHGCEQRTQTKAEIDVSIEAINQLLLPSFEQWLASCGHAMREPPRHAMMNTAVAREKEPKCVRFHGLPSSRGTATWYASELPGET